MRYRRLERRFITLLDLEQKAQSFTKVLHHEFVPSQKLFSAVPTPAYRVDIRLIRLTMENDQRFKIKADQKININSECEHWCKWTIISCQTLTFTRICHINLPVKQCCSRRGKWDNEVRIRFRFSVRYTYKQTQIIKNFKKNVKKKLKIRWTVILLSQDPCDVAVYVLYAVKFLP